MAFNLSDRLNDPLRLIIPSNTRPSCITAAAGTELAGTSFPGNIIILPGERVLQPIGSLHPRGVAGSHFRALSKILDCSFPKELGPCLSSDVAGHPLRSATDHRLGKPLLYQLPNPAKNHLLAINL